MTISFKVVKEAAGNYLFSRVSMDRQRVRQTSVVESFVKAAGRGSFSVWPLDS